MVKFSYWKIGLLFGIILLSVLVIYFLSRKNESFAIKKYKYGILMCCHNRPEILKKL